MIKLKGFVFVIVVFVLVFSLPAEKAAKKSDTHWPGFRGPNASGIAEGFPTPVSWDIETSKNIKWKITIPGLRHSSPAISGNFRRYPVFQDTPLLGRGRRQIR